jgi:membrane protein DedA with SNARE-associated domain
MSGLFDAVASVGWLVYLLTFAFLFLETAGLPLPALSFAMLAAGLAGSGQLNFVAVLVATIVGATLGAPVGHALGQHGGRPLLERIGGRVGLTPERLDAIEEQFQRRGQVIVVGRFFLPTLPWSAGIIAGIVRMPRRTLVLYTFIGITIWSAIQLTIVAFFSSVLLDIVARVSVEVLFWIATGVVGTIILILIFRWRRAASKAGLAVFVGPDVAAEQEAEEQTASEAEAPGSPLATMEAGAPSEHSAARPPNEATSAESGATPRSVEQEANK